MSDQSGLSEVIQTFKDVLIESDNVLSSSTGSASGHAVDLATKLVELERENGKKLAVMKHLEMITKKQIQFIVLQRKTRKTKEDIANAEDLKTNIESLGDELQSKVAACKADLQEQQFDNGVNDQLDGVEAALPEGSPSKRMKKEQR